MENTKILDYDIKEDEYIENDIIMCKKCKTPRLWISDDKTMYGRCICKCQQQKLKKAEEREEARLHMQQLETLKQNSLLGRRYENSYFKNLNLERPQSFVKAVERCKEYCKNWKQIAQNGMGIYLYGSVGTGKTELTACICNELISNLVPVLITNFIEISKRLRSSYQTGMITESEFIFKLSNIDLLIIDDIGSERLIKDDGTTTFLQEKIYDIINLRYTKQKPTIFTSNYSIEDLLNERGLEKKIVDRIAEMSTAVIRLEGASYRQNKLKGKKLF